jgi:hypothetical protein
MQVAFQTAARFIARCDDARARGNELGAGGGMRRAPPRFSLSSHIWHRDDIEIETMTSGLRTDTTSVAHHRHPEFCGGE